MDKRTTVETLTDAQIQALRTEAAEHGDTAQVQCCDMALAGDIEAKHMCLIVIQVAQARNLGPLDKWD